MPPYTNNLLSSEFKTVLFNLSSGEALTFLALLMLSIVLTFLDQSAKPL